jgi:glutathione S-transferase
MGVMAAAYKRSPPSFWGVTIRAASRSLSGPRHLSGTAGLCLELHERRPATTGHPEFERKLRVQENMLEQLIVFLPALWIFCLTVQPLVGAALGIVFVIGRILYSAAYAADPSKRSLGFGLGIFPTLILLIGGLVGVIRDMLIVM